MLKRITLCLALLSIAIGCKEDEQKPNQNTTAPTNLTYEQQQISQLQMQNNNYQQQLLALQTENQQLRNQIIAAGGQVPASTGGTNGLMNSSLITMLAQTVLSSLNKPQTTCTAGSFHSCVSGTTTAIMCNAQGTGFESRVVSGQCGAP